MPTSSAPAHRLLGALLASAVVVSCAACGSPPAATVNQQRGGTLVTYAPGADSCPSPRPVTALVTQDGRGCFQLDGFPVTFPPGTTWAADDGRTLRLPDGSQLRSGALVSGQLCDQAPVAAWGSYECGVAGGDAVHGLIGAVSVQPAGS